MTSAWIRVFGCLSAIRNIVGLSSKANLMAMDIPSTTCIYAGKTIVAHGGHGDYFLYSMVKQATKREYVGLPTSS